MPDRRRTKGDSIDGLRRAAVFAAAAIAGTAGPAVAAIQLTGAGSSFDFPFLSRAFYVYAQRHPGVIVNYQSIGSGGGIEQFTEKNVDFGATDVPMNAQELTRAGQPVLQIPVTLGGVAVAYDVPGVTHGLKLTRQVIAGIYLGTIPRWSDPQIARLNRGLELPNIPIVVVHRSDGSGTSYIFTDFLSRVSAQWRRRVGTGKSVAWPAPSSVGAKGNEGVAGQVRSMPGAIGYVELAYAVQNRMPAALVQNRAGKWVAISPQTVAAAAATKPGVSARDFAIVDAGCDRCWPIAGYSWLVVYENQSNKERAQALYGVLSWLVAPQGQSNASAVDYVPLPRNVERTALAMLRRMQR